MSRKRGLDKQNVIYSYHGLLSSHKRGGSTDTHYNMDVEIMVRRSQTQKALHCVIPYIWTVQNRQIHTDRKQASGCLGKTERKSWEIQASFSGDVNALKLYTGNACKHCEYTKSKCTVHFKMIKRWLLCAFYFQKKELNK